MSDPKKEIMYNGFTIEEVMAVEAMFYYIQIGDEMLENEKGKLSFTKDAAEDLFSQIMESLKHMKKFGNPEERAEAHECLSTCVRIHPLRIH